MDKLTMRRTAGEISSPFWEFFILPILRYKQMSYIIVATAVTVTLAYCLFTPNKYTSEATILPSGGTDEFSELKDLAGGSLAELGLGSLIQASENSSAMFPKVLTSRFLSEQILNQRCDFAFKGRAKTLTVAEYLDAENTDLALEALNQIVSVDVDRRTGLIALSVTTDYPEFSSQIVKNYLERLNDYNVNYRQSKARENEKFIAKRVIEASAELTQSENALEEFRAQNLNYMSSNDPELQKEQSRLERDQTVKETIYLTLVKKHELAKLEAAKDVPIVQVLDNGFVPQVKSSPRRSLYLLAALFGSVLGSILLSLWFDLFVRRRFSANLKRVVTSPDIRISKVESRLVEQANRLVALIENVRGKPGSEKELPSLYKQSEEK